MLTLLATLVMANEVAFRPVPLDEVSRRSRGVLVVRAADPPTVTRSVAVKGGEDFTYSASRLVVEERLLDLDGVGVSPIIEVAPGSLVMDYSVHELLETQGIWISPIIPTLEDAVEPIGRFIVLLHPCEAGELSTTCLTVDRAHVSLDRLAAVRTAVLQPLPGEAIRPGTGAPIVVKRGQVVQPSVQATLGVMSPSELSPVPLDGRFIAQPTLALLGPAMRPVDTLTLESVVRNEGEIFIRSTFVAYQGEYKKAAYFQRQTLVDLTPLLRGTYTVTWEIGGGATGEPRVLTGSFKVR